MRRRALRRGPAAGDPSASTAPRPRRRSRLVLGWPSGILAGIARPGGAATSRHRPRGRLAPAADRGGDRARRDQHRSSAASRPTQRPAAAGSANTLGRPWPRPSDKREIAPAYLIAGTDAAKIDAARRAPAPRAPRPRAAPGALESFAPAPGSSAGPDAEALVAAIPALSLIAEPPLPARRRGRALVRKAGRRRSPRRSPRCRRTSTVVLVAREQPPKLKAPKKLADAVEAAGGEVLAYAAPKARDLPRWLIAEAGRRGFELDARRRASCWSSGWATAPCGWRPSSTGSRSGPGRAGRSTRDDLEAMIADTSEEVVWALSDAIVDRDPASGARGRRAARRPGRGRDAARLPGGEAAARGEPGARAARGRAVRRSEVEAALPMHPYAAKMLVRRLGDRGRARSCGPRPARSPTSSGGRAAARTTRARGADARGAPRRRDAVRRYEARPARTRAARAFLRAPVLRCSAPLRTALSIREKSALCSASAAASSPEATAASSRRKWVLTALVSAAVLVSLAQGAGVALLL